MWKISSATRLALAAGVLASVSPSSSSAASPARQPALTYHAPPECPNAEAFTALVASRTASWSESVVSLSVDVEIVATKSEARGKIVIRRNRRVTVREVQAEHCGDVVTALALIVAILIDPDADTRPIPEPSKSPSADATSEPTAAPLRSSTGRDLRVSAGAQLGFASGIAPQLVLGTRWVAALDVGESSAWPSSLRLSLTRARTGTISADERGASAAFEIDTVRLDACALRLARSELRLEPCLLVEGGALHADGHHPAQSRSRNLPWGGVGALLRGVWTVWDALGLEAELGALFPLWRYRFNFEESLPIYETPLLGLTGGLGAAVRFP
jgi:hypothetical protein